MTDKYCKIESLQAMQRRLSRRSLESTRLCSSENSRVGLCFVGMIVIMFGPR